MSTPIIQKEVNNLMLRFKDKSLREQIVLSLNYLDSQLKEYPLVVLYHEMKKELEKMKKNL